MLPKQPISYKAGMEILWCQARCMFPVVSDPITPSQEFEAIQRSEHLFNMHINPEHLDAQYHRWLDEGDRNLDNWVSFVPKLYRLTDVNNASFRSSECSMMLSPIKFYSLPGSLSHI